MLVYAIKEKIDDSVWSSPPNRVNALEYGSVPAY